MPLVNVNVGDAANDGTGDSLRGAFQKVTVWFDAIHGVIQAAVVTVDDRASLKLLDPPEVKTSAFMSAGSVDGLIWTFLPLSDAADNGGNICQPASAPALGRWFQAL